MIVHFDLTDEERASAAWDAYLCQNLMARFTGCQELGQEAAAFDALWSAREDISYGDNGGFMVGRDSVRGFWVEDRQKGRRAELAIAHALDPEVPLDDSMLGLGTMERINLMSPLIEVARDGQTAKGMWYCPGADTKCEADGKQHLQWHYIRFAVDFIREDGNWKLWHVFAGSEFRFEMGHAYIPATGMKPLPDATVYPEEPAVRDFPRAADCRRPYDLPVQLYSIDYGWSAYPAVPVPYETFGQTFSYGPEPFLPAT